MKAFNRNSRSAFSLLELLVAMTLMVSAVTAVSVLLRVNYSTWLEFRSATYRNESAVGALRHLVRNIRQAQYVTAISTAGDSSGSLSLLSSDGQTLVWDHSGTEILFGQGAASSVLANHIDSLTLVGYERDGITQTTNASDIQIIRITVTYQVPHRATSSRTLTAIGWVRSFR